MSILLCVSIACVTFCSLFMGLGLIVLLIVEHFSNTSQVTIDDEAISDRALQMAKLDGAMDEPVQQARELADTCDLLAKLDDTVTLAPRDAIPDGPPLGPRSDPAHGRRDHSRSKANSCTHLERSKWRRA